MLGTLATKWGTVVSHCAHNKHALIRYQRHRGHRKSLRSAESVRIARGVAPDAADTYSLRSLQRLPTGGIPPAGIRYSLCVIRWRSVGRIKAASVLRKALEVWRSCSISTVQAG